MMLLLLLLLRLPLQRLLLLLLLQLVVLMMQLQQLLLMMIGAGEVVAVIKAVEGNAVVRFVNFSDFLPIRGKLMVRGMTRHHRRLRLGRRCWIGKCFPRCSLGTRHPESTGDGVGHAEISQST